VSLFLYNLSSENPYVKRKKRKKEKKRGEAQRILFWLILPVIRVFGNGRRRRLEREGGKKKKITQGEGEGGGKRRGLIGAELYP